MTTSTSTSTSHGGDVAALGGFRSDLYDCLCGWGDTLFELCDAVLCSPTPVASVPSLSLEPVFRRSHGSLYKALARSGVDTDQLRRLLISNLPAHWPPVYAVDASTWDRCDAECSPERGFYYSASKHSAGQPIVAGWNYQWISQLSFTPDSWTAPCDVTRIPPTADTTNTTIDQVRRLVTLLPADGDVPMFVFDAGYDPIAISHELDDTRTQVLCRIHDDRVFHAEPSPRPNRPASTGGRPPRHGRQFKCVDPATWNEPAGHHTTTDPRYGTVTVTAWNRLHPRLCRRGHWAGHDLAPIVAGTVIPSLSNCWLPLWLSNAGREPRGTMSTSTVEPVVSRPGPEVRAPNRSYPPKYKLQILAEIDAAQTRGEIGAIMRREGLYSSLISEWRKQRERGALEAMSGRRRGRKSDPVVAENTRLRARVTKLEDELATAGELIEAQGKSRREHHAR